MNWWWQGRWSPGGWQIILTLGQTFGLGILFLRESFVVHIGPATLDVCVPWEWVFGKESN